MIVGAAQIVVRAVTSGVKNDIRRGFKDVDGIGGDAGDRVGKDFKNGLARGMGDNVSSILNVGGLVAAAEAAGAAFSSLQRRGNTLIAILVAVGGIIGALIGGLGVLAGIVIGASPTLLGLGVAAISVATSFAILKSVFSGVGEAIASQSKGTSDLADKQERLADAATRELDTQYALNELTKQQARDIKDLEDRYKDSADAQTDANIAVERSERNYQNSVKATEQALEDVTTAREDAKEAIQQLRFELEGGVISEKKARLEFEKARDSLQRVQDLPPNSRARREAELAFSEADLNLRRAIDKNNDLRKSTAKTNKEGVDGNAKVVAAQQAVQKAIISQSDAEIDAAKAVRSLVKATEAKLAIEEQLRANSPFYEAQRRALELADRAVTEALKDQAKAAKEAAAALKEDPYAKLTPSAKAFVDFIVSLKDELDALKKVLQENFFAKFTPAVKELVDTYLPLLKELLPPIATALGEVAEKIKEVFTRPAVIAAIETLLKDMPEQIKALGGIFTNLAASFVILLAAFSPFYTMWLKYVEKLTEGWLETLEIKKANGELEESFKTAAETMDSLWTSLGNLLGGIGNTVKAIFTEGGAGHIFLTWLEEATEKFEQFTKQGEADGTLSTYLADITTNFTLILDNIGLILKGLLDLAASQGLKEFLEKSKEANVIWNEVALDISKSLPALGDLNIAAAEFTEIFLDGDGIGVFFKTLAIVIGGVALLLDNEFARAIIGAAGLIVGFTLAIGLLSLAMGFMGKVGVNAILKLDAKFLAKLPQSSKLVYNLRFAVLALQGGLVALAAPILIVIAVIVIIAAILKTAYDQSEIFRNAISDLNDALMKAVKDGIEKIKKAIEDIIGPVEGVMNVFKSLGDFLGKYIVPFFEGVLVVAINLIVDAIILVIKFVAAFFTSFTDPIGAFTKRFGAMLTFIKDTVESIAKAFGFKISWAWLTDGLSSALTFIAKGINGVINYINGLIKDFNRIPFVPNIPPITFKIPIPVKLAKGGVVPATQGGMLATIGEAGRPERVEPLDPDGLSKRDKAMIQLLSGGGGVNITVNPAPGMDERELAAMVSRQLAFQLRKGA